MDFLTLINLLPADLPLQKIISDFIGCLSPEQIETIDAHFIFTSYKKALEIVKDKLESQNIKCFVIDGSVSSKKRNELVNSFNNDDTNVFLIMLKAGGTGLNLTSADTVIHLYSFQILS